MNNQDDVKMIENIKILEQDQFAAWHRIIELQQLFNATKIISVFYDQFNLEEGLLTLILDGSTLDFPIQTFADANGSELQIQVQTGPTEESLHEAIEGEHNTPNDRRFLTAGTLRDCSDAPNTLLITLDDDILRLIENDQLSIPESGWVRIKIENEKLQLGHIQQAIDHIAKARSGILR